MNSQIVANIDSELKSKAMAKAKKEWITLKAIISIFLKWYVEDQIYISAKWICSVDDL